MGHYTRFQCSFTLKKDTPLEIIHYLNYIISNNDWEDVEKRNCAKEHNLNFKEVWSLKEGKEFIDNLI